MPKTKPTKAKSTQGSNGQEARSRLNVLKTYKIYIGGKFPRTESGRYYILKSKEGARIANMSRASRKDFRDAVVAARAAFNEWSSKAAFNRGQVLYRLAEILEGRKTQFIDEIILQGASGQVAETEVTQAIDRLVYFAGWCDKYRQVFSSVNPVASSHFNFSVPEPTGVVAVIAPEEMSLLGLISVVAPVIAGGNTCVVLASEGLPLCAVTFAEVLHTSDVPAGVVNILTGKKSELIDHFSNHMDVNAIIYCGGDEQVVEKIKIRSTSNLKRPVIYKNQDMFPEECESPYRIMDAQEIKTTWHPIGT